jgi:hypothetical protein
LHIACFITLCESFPGDEPHWILWKFLFHFRPSVSLSKNPELGGAVVLVRAEAHYMEFSMAVLWSGSSMHGRGPIVGRIRGLAQVI